MIYLTTGANGAGKTLCTLRDVRDKQVAEGRPVYFCGFDPKPQLIEWGWQKCEFKDWQSLPDGSIVIGDEAHNFMPAGLKVDVEPGFVKMLAEHRKRGFDFFLIDQHPSNISPFVRRLIGSPGWHRHLKRTFGAELVSELKWSAANITCEKPGAAQSAEVRMRPFPKEVYEWYSSAMIHTGKRSIPRAVYVAIGMLVAAVALAFVSYRLLMGSPRVVAAQGPAKAASAPSNGLVARAPVAAPGAHPGASAALSAAQYIESRTPRIAGLPQTAPAFDAVTVPVTAPYPAACVSFK
ncbi:MAG: zonular occludens toxin domain-containing protein [Polynucleobacter sp.]|nr:zonular occludens toxin domain-containing protein [Polynucleobacter sp.]